MSMLGSQANELRNRAKVLRQGDWSDGADDAALMEQAADTIEGLRDSLNEAAGRWADAQIDAEVYARENMLLKAHNGTRWHELFGTPERAARTVLSLDYCCEDCDKCQAFEICGLHSKFGRTVCEMTEWLKGADE